MSVLLVHMPMNRHVGIKMFAAVMVFGIATVIFSISTSLAISLVALVILGAADNVSVVIRISLVQLSTPDAMRGRVSAVNSLFVGTSNQLGEFESGMLGRTSGRHSLRNRRRDRHDLDCVALDAFVSGSSQHRYAAQGQCAEADGVAEGCFA